MAEVRTTLSDGDILAIGRAAEILRRLTTMANLPTIVDHGTGYSPDTWVWYSRRIAGKVSLIDLGIPGVSVIEDNHLKMLIRYFKRLPTKSMWVEVSGIPLAKAEWKRRKRAAKIANRGTNRDTDRGTYRYWLNRSIH